MGGSFSDIFTHTTMNYLILQSIIDTMSANFRCQQCGASIGPQNINLLGTSGKDISVEISCPQCHTNALMKAEINQVGSDIMSDEQRKAFLDAIGQQGIDGVANDIIANIQFSFDSRTAKTQGVPHGVKDADILSLRDTFQKKNITVSELLGDLPDMQDE